MEVSCKAVCAADRVFLCAENPRRNPFSGGGWRRGRQAVRGFVAITGSGLGALEVGFDVDGPRGEGLVRAMFTGIVEETGTVESVHPGDQSIRLTLSLRKTGTGLKVGDSLSVNGCCLTVAELAAKGRTKTAQFDLLQKLAADESSGLSRGIVS